ncbi:hypothetical protein KXQ82_10410 [Mucilaginibacter sp. HMF5004]|uniref:hypothetical protein n=1 Tax=Mucilaginibacter rivuli TaxID=2857527 RepID=UPI001C5FCB7B|nr:hypothetical protein [Mucilaginibacter rivuli]MBW4890131.1 hypothetical protein [Mucilaginibacter rivuli]
MVKASALYIVIVIALMIGVICSALIFTAYYYKLQYQRKFRYDRLQTNLNSATHILLGSDAAIYNSEKKIDLYQDQEDSVSLKTIPWGMYTIGICKSFKQNDTLYKAFSIANTIDSMKWAALYIIDEDRPLSVSGNTQIRGTAYVPKAGIKEAYVDGKAYQGDKRLVIGQKRNSEKTLPKFQIEKLAYLNQFKTPFTDTVLPKTDSLNLSYFSPCRVFNFKRKVMEVSNIKLSGNVVLYSDTAITIDNTCTLKNVIVYAKSIHINEGFNGTCQLFATDSITVDKNCNLNYPSCLGILRYQNDKRTQGKITAGENCTITGSIFTYEKEKSTLQTLIDIGKGVKIYGQIYAQGLVRFNKGGDIKGSLFTNRFLYQSAYTTYENYLINTSLDTKGLSRYYLSSPLFPVAAKKQKVLQWLEGN